MSLIDDLRVLTAPGTRVPNYVSDMIACFRELLKLPEVQTCRAMRNLLSMMTTVAMRCAEALGEAPHCARLEALVSPDSKGKLLTHLTTEYGIDSISHDHLQLGVTVVFFCRAFKDRVSY